MIGIPSSKARIAAGIGYCAAAEMGETWLFVNPMRQWNVWTSRRTSIQGSDEAPISGMYHVAVTVPAFSPLHGEAVIRAIEIRPEAEIERRDKEDPVQRCACTGVGGVVWLWRAEMERVGMPCPRGIAVFDKAVSYL